MTIKKITQEVENISKKYAEEFQIKRTPEWFILKLQEEVGELTQAYLMKIGQARLKGKSQEDLDASFRRELSDVFSQVLLIANHYDVNLEKEVDDKWLVYKK